MVVGIRATSNDKKSGMRLLKKGILDSFCIDSVRTSYIEGSWSNETR